MSVISKQLWAVIVLVVAGSAAAAVHGLGGPVDAQSRLLEDGRIAIDRPTTITESGSYVVTRNIRNLEHEGVGIVIAADDVELDLGGFSVWGNSASITAAGIEGLVIRDGKLTSDNNGLYLWDVEVFAIRRLIIRAGDDQSISMQHARNGVVEDNLMSSCSGCGGERAIFAEDVEFVDFVRNRWNDHHVGGIYVSGSFNRVVENTGDGGISVDGVGNIVRDNITGSVSVGNTVD